ncbi:hypothetical protein L873DRAFT_1808491 [Choiromyces venosus 120613-1]|uniref:Uncharacterized protein n=1 Tax=Choiromyces venosus 120613-1 TaxID=1336337 RepID=A0A3N4JX16_9PEZI|nr:hypothetical protein L873DRAFT_1808491 [Choiromyces venosus 120613-1]
MKSHTKSPNRDPNNHGQVKSLKTLSADEIHYLCVPENLGQIEEQELIVYSTLPSNDPVAWGLKKIISNFAIMARRAMTELEVKDQCIANLESQLAISKTKKVRNRTRIATHGKAWVDREDIRKFFAEQTQSQQRTAQQRCRNLETLITKHRKTVSQLEEEETHLCKQIQEAETRLESAQYHCNDLRAPSAESTVNEGEDCILEVEVEGL